MNAHLIDTHLLLPRSRSSAKIKVKYQDHVSQKMGVSGALVFHKHILFFFLNFRPVQFKDIFAQENVDQMVRCVFEGLKTLWKKEKTLHASFICMYHEDT